MEKIEFKSIIKKHPDIDGCYVEIPFDIYEIFGKKRVKVKALFDNEPYRGSIVNMGGCYLIGITKEIRNKINKNAGDEITVSLEEDLEERIVSLPDELEKLFQDDTNLKSSFDKLSYTKQKEIVLSLNNAKKCETKKIRIEKIIQQLKK